MGKRSEAEFDLDCIAFEKEMLADTAQSVQRQKEVSELGFIHPLTQ